MTEQNDNTEPKRMTLRLVVSWIFALVFWLIGFVVIFTSFVTGALFIVAALILLPPANAFAKKKWNFAISGPLKFIIVLILVIAAPIVGAIKPTAEVVNQINENVQATNTVVPPAPQGISNQVAPPPQPAVKPIAPAPAPKPATPPPASKPSPQIIYYPVVSVTDGDTFKVNINGTIETVRAIGIDTPETVDPRKPVQCFGKEASNRSKALLTSKNIKLESDPTQGDRDKYGRLLRYAWLEDGTFFNKQMIADGYASEYTYKVPYKYQEEFKAAEAEARAAKLGLWADDACIEESSNPPPPAAQPGGHTFYTSSYYSAKFYYCDTDDGWKGLSPKYLKSFLSAEALLQSYSDRILHETCK
ncbi:MAG: thermonuclease family protein [Patescibacteria group bacterium]